MVDSHTSTIYATAAAAQAAINVIATDKIITVVSFMEGNKQKFMVIAKVG